MRYQKGFSVVKLLFVLAVLAAGTVAAYKIVPVYSTYWKVQDAFEAVTRNLSGQPAGRIRTRLPDIFHVKYIAYSDLPKEFYDNLEIKVEGGRIEISSVYHVTLWLLGPLESVNPDEPYTAKDLKGMDKIRDKARLDFDFEPYAETP
ncbi:MAG: DUF4845 domain-containing protein [Mariprofundaceae bacterium]|nr:DUF4845 domain-containing protein [Mariprofundaceae bacterium]